MPLLKNLKTNEVLEVARKKVIIGRHSGDDMTVNDPKCSRSNSEISFRDGDYYIKDRGSRNGTTINGERITDEVKIKYGDKIIIGATELEFIKTPEKIDIEITGYEIIEHTASGGMGKVFKARQLSLDRIVAIKVLSPKFTHDPRLTENFINEARSAGRLNHPNLVQVHDVNKDFQKNGQVIYYFTMEFVDGPTIKEMIREQKTIPALQVIEILMEVCKGLEYIHANKLVHRDIKPDNLMIDVDGNIKIADLGIAIDTSEHSGEEVTEDGQRRIVGTPHYISPEQARGKNITHLSDIYSLGATAYHMLTGETPFEGEDSKDIIKKHVHATPTPIQEHNPDVPNVVCELVEKMMSKDSATRPQTAAQLREELDIVRAKLDKHKSRTRLHQNKRERKTNPFMLALSTLIGLAIAFLIFYVFIKSQNRKPTKENNPVITENQNNQNNGNAVNTDINTRIQEAKSLVDENKFDDAIQVYTKIKNDYPEHQIVKDLDVLIKKTNAQKEELVNQAERSKVLEAYQETQSFKNGNLNNPSAIVQKYDDFIATYPDSQEAKLLKRESNALKNEIKRIAEEKKLENFKNILEAEPSEIKSIELIETNRKEFSQATSVDWLNKKKSELEHKLSSIVQRAQKDIQNVIPNIKNSEYQLAISRLTNYLSNYDYDKAQELIKNKINEVHDISRRSAVELINQQTEKMLNFEYNDVLIDLEPKLIRYKDSKGHNDIDNYIKKIKLLDALHERCVKILSDEKELKIPYTETIGAFEYNTSVYKADRRKVETKHQADGRPDSYKPKVWGQLEKEKTYLIYETALHKSNELLEYKSHLKAFVELHKVSMREANTKRIQEQ